MSGNRLIRIIIYTIELLLLYVLQSTSVLPEIGGARPLVLVSAAMMIAMFEGDLTGMAIGIAAGLLIDLAGADILGFHGLILGLCGYALGAMTMELFKTNLLVAMLAMLAVVPVVCLLEWVVFFILPGYAGADYVFRIHVLPKMIYTYATVPVLYAVNRFFALRLSEAA